MSGLKDDVDFGMTCEQIMLSRGATEKEILEYRKRKTKRIKTLMSGLR